MYGECRVVGWWFISFNYFFSRLANTDDYYTGILLVRRENVSSSYVTRVAKSAHCEQFLSAINRLRGLCRFPPEIFRKRRVSCVCPTCLRDARRRPRARETQMRKSVDRDVRRGRFIDALCRGSSNRPRSFSRTVYSERTLARLRTWYSIASRGLSEAASETRRTRVYGL